MAVVTGGASGIGLAIAELFASFGARVMIVDRYLEATCGAADMINGADLVVDGGFTIR